jgi:prepilin-type N-terminal cleavage/methylation domain-containing protein
MKNIRGFTLIELIIVILIIGIIGGIVGFILLGTVDAWTFKFNRSDLLWDGRLAVNRMVRELREIKNLTSVTTAGPSELRFVNVDDADITYSLTGIDLDRTEAGTANVLAEDISDLTFTYLDSIGNTIPAPVVAPGTTDIRRIRIKLTLTKNGENVYLQSECMPRNF